MKKYYSHVCLLLLLVVILLVSCCKKQPTPVSALTAQEQSSVIQKMASDPSNWAGWDLLHEDNLEWFFGENMKSDDLVSDPLRISDAFFLEAALEVAPEYAAERLVASLLDSMSAAANNRNFTILAYHIPQQRLSTNEDVINSAFALCGTDELPTSEEELREWCKSYFSSYPGLGEDMWFFSPSFSFQWEGQCGIATYEECVQNGRADSQGLVDVFEVLARSPESNIFVLVKVNDMYRLQNAEVLLSSASHAKTRVC